MSNSVNRMRDALAMIKRLLLEEWDPIGVSQFPEAQDEYDAYAPGVYQLLSRRPTPSEVFEHLWQLETQQMGLRGDREKTKKIAEKLVALTQEGILPGDT
ncbi:MAG TPA: hypothetical protein VFA20_33165 [Myxococcaceae bacterium]|nr:hypothetical protein [Myxococcaceae bacterium]